MEFDFARSFCPLCEQDHAISDVVPLNNCPCVFCHRCLTAYFTTQLNNIAESQTRQAFYAHFKPGATGSYVDDEGATQIATVVNAQFQDDLESSVLDLKLENDQTISAPYWRVTMLEGPLNEMLSTGFGCMECPTEGCYGVITKADAREMFPEVYGSYLEGETVLKACLSGCIRCPYPECRCLIERISASNQHPALAGKDHGEQYRFRCAGCQKDFCGICLSKPYHTGFNCYQFKMPDCRYCSEKLDPTQAPPIEAQNEQSMTVRQLKELARSAEVDISWCIEKNDFLFVAQRIKSVCHSQECRALLKKSCTKRLPCGHGCIGVCSTRQPARYRHTCLSCFEPNCPHSSAEYDGCQICWESFTASPCIQLPCKHLIHLGKHLHPLLSQVVSVECARQRIVQGYPGPSITFNHLYCSMCGAAGVANRAVQIATSDCALNHPLLRTEIQPILKLRETVTKMALTQLKATDDIKAPVCHGSLCQDLKLRDLQELQPGGEFEGRPADFALKRYMYYMCNRCKKPYFGGLRDCQAAANQNAAAFDPKELICGSCCALAAGQNCPRHGTRYIEWKCR